MPRTNPKDRYLTPEELRRKHAKLHSLRCFPEVDKKIRAGVPIERIAEWIQEDMMEYTDATRGTLIQQLYRYRRDLPPNEIQMPVPTYIQQKIEKLKKGVNELEELEKLYLFQLQRIEIDAKNEEKIGKLFKDTRKEIALARDILVAMLEKKLQLGLLKEAPKELHITRTDVGVEGGFLGEVDEATKQRLSMVAAKIVTGMLKLTPEQQRELVIDAEFKEVGKSPPDDESDEDSDQGE